MGSFAPRRKGSTEMRLHPAIDESARRESHDSIDLRFEALGAQTRDGTYPLHMAVSKRAPIKVLDMLVNEAPDTIHLPNKFGETPLHLALSGAPGSRLDEAIELLLQRDELNTALEMPERRGGNLPLHLAVKHECS